MPEITQEILNSPTLTLIVIGFSLLAGFGFLWVLITRLPKLLIRTAVGAFLLVIFGLILVAILSFLPQTP